MISLLVFVSYLYEITNFVLRLGNISGHFVMIFDLNDNTFNQTIYLLAG